MLRSIARNIQRCSGMLTKKPSTATVTYCKRRNMNLPVPKVLTPWYILATPEGYRKITLKDLGVRRRRVIDSSIRDTFKDRRDRIYHRRTNGMIVNA